MNTKPTFKDFMLYGIAAGLLLVIIVYFFLITFVPHQNDNSVTQVIPVFVAIESAVIGYLYGSSTSSKQKDETIDALAKPAPGTTTTTTTP